MKIVFRYGIILSFFIVGVFWNAGSIFADEFTSTNFTVEEPVMTSGGTFSSSTSFQLLGTISQIAIGTSTATSFGVNAGFFYYPFVSTPVVSRTAGDGQVSLSWTEATGVLGWTVSGYNVGQSTVSGGPYTYTASLGSGRSSTRTGLTNGTTYYFIIRAEDAFGNSIATSTEVSAKPAAGAAAEVSVSTGGGGGGGSILSATTVIFEGRAYPGSSVTLLKDAQIAVKTVAGGDAKFSMSLSGISSGDYIFSVYSNDKDGRRSSLLTFSISVTSGATTKVSGIFISPTIDIDKEEVKKGDNIAIFGQSAPQSEIIINVGSEEEFFAKIKSDKDGVYLYNFDTSPLDLGQHFTKSKSALGGEVSVFGKIIGFWVSTKNVIKVAKPAVFKSDLNGDGRVNLIDFSIAAYWYKRQLSEIFKTTEKERLNGDGKVDLIDFSIMAYYWTG